MVAFLMSNGFLPIHINTFQTHFCISLYLKTAQHISLCLVVLKIYFFCAFDFFLQQLFCFYTFRDFLRINCIGYLKVTFFCFAIKFKHTFKIPFIHSSDNIFLYFIYFFFANVQKHFFLLVFRAQVSSQNSATCVRDKKK